MCSVSAKTTRPEHRPARRGRPLCLVATRLGTKCTLNCGPMEKTQIMLQNIYIYSINKTKATFCALELHLLFLLQHFSYCINIVCCFYFQETTICLSCFMSIYAVVKCTHYQLINKIYFIHTKKQQFIHQKCHVGLVCKICNKAFYLGIALN